MTIKIALLSNFKADNRISMDGYHHQISYQLNKHLNQNQYQVKSYIPQSKFAIEQNKWMMRLSRYISYPHQVRSIDSDIYHIMDHGYAHLVNKLPSHRCIVTVHDLIPFLLYKNKIDIHKRSENHYRLSRRFPILAKYSLSCLKKAAHIIAISENTKQDLIKYNFCNKDKISVIYPGLLNDNTTTSLTKQQARNQLFKHLILSSIDAQIMDGLKIILICGESFYKNLSTSIQVINSLQSEHDNIVALHWGKESEEWNNALKKSHYPERVMQLPYIQDDDIKLLYKSVDLVLFPSIYEGFGLPPVEAMSQGTPAVVSNTSSLPEAVGGLEYCCSPYDIDSLIYKSKEILFNDDYRKIAIQHGLDHAKKFTWQSNIKKLEHIYNLVI